MNFAYLLKKHKFLSVEEQKAILSDYALKNQLLSLEFRTTKIEKDLSLGKLSENDIITMADIFLLGLNFQDIMQMLDLICSKGIELHIVSENLFFNKTQPSCYIFNACLKIYKTLLSVKNKLCRKHQKKNACKSMATELYYTLRVQFNNLWR